jgi:hypothetical protein
VKRVECQVSSDKVDGDREKNMKIKITVLILCAMLFALCLPADAQQLTGKLPLSDPMPAKLNQR